MLKRITALLLISMLALSACGKVENEQSNEESKAEEISTTISMEETGMSEEESVVEESSEPEVKRVLDGSNLVVFGDSITALGSWGESIAEELNMYFFNGAMGGITSAQGLNRFSAFVANREPDFVTLCFGMNDLIMTAPDQPRVSVAQFKKNMYKMVDMVIELGAVPIIITTNPLVNEVFFASQGQSPDWYTNVGTPLEWLDTYNDAAREVAAESGCLLADVRKACDEYTPKQVDNSDGIHLNALGNKIFVETVVACLTENFERDLTVAPVDRHPFEVVDSGVVSVISLDAEDWYIPEKGSMIIRSYDGALHLYNTTGLWPDAHYVPSVPIAADPTKASLHVKFKTAGAGTSLQLFFNFATPSAWTDNRYVVINSLLGLKTEAYSGDVLPNQTCDVTIPLTKMNIPKSCYNDDGLVIFSGMKIYVPGMAYETVEIEAIELVFGE